MLKSFKYRINPDIEQVMLLEKHFNCSRLVYNLALEAKKQAYSGSKISLSYNKLASQLIDLKAEYTWLKEINSQALQSSLKNLDIAFQNFFKHKADFPNFKKKINKQSFQCPQNVTVDFDKSMIYLPKFKAGIKIILHRKFKGAIKTVTISKTPTNKYFASILVDNKQNIPDKVNINSKTTIGIDLGIKSFAVLSDGFTFDNPKYLKHSLDRLAFMQKSLSHKKKGSNRRKLWRLRVAKLHEKITNQRYDFLHKISNEITNRFDTICMENLKIKNMIKNHCLAQAINDVSWGKFVEFIKYKSEWKGKNFVQIGSFEPSSKTCNICGSINHDLTLKNRNWTCAVCGSELDRDNNASINIKNSGLKKLRGMGCTCQDIEVANRDTVEMSKIQDCMLALPS